MTLEQDILFDELEVAAGRREKWCREKEAEFARIRHQNDRQVLLDVITHFYENGHAPPDLPQLEDLLARSRDVTAEVDTMESEAADGVFREFKAEAHENTNKLTAELAEWMSINDADTKVNWEYWIERGLFEPSGPSRIRLLYRSPLWNTEAAEALEEGDEAFKAFDLPRRIQSLRDFHLTAFNADVEVAYKIHNDPRADPRVIVQEHLLKMQRFLEDLNRQRNEEIRDWREARRAARTMLGEDSPRVVERERRPYAGNSHPAHVPRQTHDHQPPQLPATVTDDQGTSAVPEAHTQPMGTLSPGELPADRFKQQAIESICNNDVSAAISFLMQHQRIAIQPLPQEARRDARSRVSPSRSASPRREPAPLRPRSPPESVLSTGSDYPPSYHTFTESDDVASLTRRLVEDDLFLTSQRPRRVPRGSTASSYRPRGVLMNPVPLPSSSGGWANSPMSRSDTESQSWRLSSSSSTAAWPPNVMDRFQSGWRTENAADVQMGHDDEDSSDESDVESDSSNRPVGSIGAGSYSYAPYSPRDHRSRAIPRQIPRPIQRQWGDNPRPSLSNINLGPPWIRPTSRA